MCIAKGYICIRYEGKPRKEDNLSTRDKCPAPMCQLFGGFTVLSNFVLQMPIIELDLVSIIINFR